MTQRLNQAAERTGIGLHDLKVTLTTNLIQVSVVYNSSFKTGRLFYIVGYDLFIEIFSLVNRKNRGKTKKYKS